MILTSYLLTFFYLSLLVFLSIGLFLHRKTNITKDSQGISIIVAARNEENNIRNVLTKLIKQSYPKDRYEIIIVDDRSEDNTKIIVDEFCKSYSHIKILSIPTNEKGGKKRALNKGINEAKFSLLAFTDADCLPQPNWLNEINKHFHNDIDIVAKSLSAKPLEITGNFVTIFTVLFIFILPIAIILVGVIIFLKRKHL